MATRQLKGAAKLSSYIKPMLAQLTDIGPFDDPDWLFEIKWDGYRAIAEIKDGNVKLYSRNGLSFEKAYAKVFAALGKIKENMIIDGEIVVFDDNDKPSFQLLQNYSNSSSNTIQYLVFDCLSYDGKKITSLQLVERKEILQKLFPKGGIIQYCDHVLADGKALFKEIQNAEMEGIIAKRIASKYIPGKRNTDWLKIKNVKSDEAIIVGFTEPKGSRVGFGSLLLAQYIGGKLRYIGNVGTGFNEKVLKDLHRTLSGISTTKSSLDQAIKPPPHTTWVRPQLVCNVQFTERTSDGMIRHPVFLGLRVDKKPSEVVPEKTIGKKASAKARGKKPGA